MTEDSNFSRKGFLNKFLLTIKKGVSNHVDHKLAKTLNVPIRPPGALEEVEFLSTCTRCNKCADACPHDAILRMPLDRGLSANTPFLQPDGQVCQLCPDLPCIASCTDEALQPLASAKEVRIGHAIVDSDACLAFQGKVCTLCYDACPLPEEALSLVAFHPRVLDACTGCGACQQRCPVFPVGIKVLSPAAWRSHKVSEETYFGLFSKDDDC